MSTSYGGTPPGLGGATHYGGAGLGVLGALVPSEGEHGPGYVYNDLALPADAEKEVRGVIETGPAPAGLSMFFAREDSSFDAAGADGVYAFTYRLYDDGLDRGTAVATFTLGSGVGAVLTGGVELAPLAPAGTLGSGVDAVLTGGIELAPLAPAGTLSAPAPPSIGRYATLANMIDEFGSRELIELTDRGTPRTNEIDLAVLGRALARADAEIDGYAQTRYPVPLSPVPELVRGLACDIARYRLYDAVAPETVRTRYEDARALLRDIAAGKVNLGTDESGVVVAPPKAPAVFGTSRNDFARPVSRPRRRGLDG
jgi:phage gp36-like protein